MRPSSGHWSEIGERGAYIGLAFTLFVYRRLGRWAVAPILYLVVAYFFVTGAGARRAAGRYLVRAREAGARNAPSRFGLFMSFGRAILDKIAAWSGRLTAAAVDYTNYPLFQTLIDSRQGAVLIASHLGNIDVCRALVRERYPVRINVLVHTRHAENFNRLMREVSPATALNLIEVTNFSVEAAMMLQARVQAGEFVVIAGDRVPVGDSARVGKAWFLGAEAYFPQGAFILAGLLDCPTRLIFGLREGKRYRIVFEDFPHLQGLSRRNRDTKLAAAIAAYAERLAFYCCCYPDQWYNFYDFWAAPRAVAQSSMA